MTPHVLILLLVFVVTSSLRAEQPAFKLSIAVPVVYAGRAISPNGPHFHVILTNVSSVTQKIWQDWNSWGAQNLSFEITDAAGNTSKARVITSTWTMNYPSWFALPPGEVHVFDVYFSDHRLWEGFPQATKGPEAVSMRAIYFIASSRESREEGIWIGKLISEPLPVTFYGPKYGPK